MSARKSWLPEGGTNLFQDIKAKRNEAKAKGITPLKLSIGQPQGPAFRFAREVAAKAIMSDEESMHEYQDNGSPGVPNFAKRFVQTHNKIDLDSVEDLDYLPIPGIKPILGLIPLACGAETTTLVVRTTTSPGYSTPADWCKYLRQKNYPLSTNSDNEFLFSIDKIKDELTDLLMVNYPHNPTGQIAARDWWHERCEFCQEEGIRFFNDASYAALVHSNEACTLADVATQYPGLSWAESYSASKLIGNGTGWRVGAMVGSSDFIGDIKKIKGNTDSGFVAAMAAGVIAVAENFQDGIEKSRQVYESRLQMLISILKSRGMQLAVEPKAGFFSLWLAPKKAFGQEIENAEQFNYMMIDKTGIEGVQFDPYIRYAVCNDVLSMKEKIEDVFEQAKVSYD